MEDMDFQLGPNPQILFRACADDIRIHGGDQLQVRLLSRKDTQLVQVQQGENTLEVSAPVAVTAIVPAGARVVLQNCAGDIRGTAFQSLSVQEHRGDLALYDIGSVELVNLRGDVQLRASQSLRVTGFRGDLEARIVREEIDVADVHGDISLRGVRGRLALKGIDGDVLVLDPEGQLDISGMNGDLEFRADLHRGQYNLETNGDIEISLEPESDARLDLEAQHGRVHCAIPLVDAQTSARSVSGHLGSDGAQLKAIASQDIQVRALRGEDLREEMERERAHAEAFARREVAHALRMAEKAHRVSERLSQKAQDRAERLRHWQSRWSTLPRRATSQDLEGERLTVLKMLAEHKIDADQAEALLRALEQ